MEQLRSIREEHNLRQTDIANILGIDRTTYTSYEIERDTIPITHLNKLCNYFNISVDYAMGLSNKKQYKDSRPEIDKNILKERLKILRKKNKLTQFEIAKILNTSRSTWTGYEHGNYLIPTLLLLALAKKYHYSMDYLLGKIDKNN
ncbi:MAG: helix-turn-helix transcriptional regulator [Firmicutes bacterium]|nr:helix-turn-helix transcriptional regulator [Bacillota bacterium]